MAVVLPAPLWPNKQNIWDSYNDNDKLSTALKWPNNLDSFEIWILGGTLNDNSSLYKAELISSDSYYSSGFMEWFNFLGAPLIKNSGCFAMPYSLGTIYSQYKNKMK